MPQPIRSIRLEKRSTRSLNVLSGSVGEIFYDSENSALRLFTASAGTNVTLADRDWVTANFANASNSFSGAYSDLTGTPAAITNLSAFTNDAGFITADDVDVDISSINSIGDVDTATNAPTTGQLLQWDGVKWANATVAGLADTNTTYALSGEASGIGVDLKLTDVDGTQFAVNIRGGAGITPSITSTNQITISNSSALTNLTDATVINPAEGQILKYTSGTWINVTPAVVDGVTLNDLSVTNDATGAGAGALAYNSGTGEFTFTPADLSGAISLTSLSLSQAAASGGGTLAYDNTSGAFTFSPANLSTYAQTSSLPTSITELGVTDGTNGQVLTTDGSGNFTFSSAGGGASYDQDLNTTDSVVFAAVSADTFSNASAGAPVVTSATTITLEAPDGVIIDDEITTTSNTDLIINPGGTGGVVINSDSGTAALTINGTYLGLDQATAAPQIHLINDSATPAVNDVVGKILFQQPDSSGSTQMYGGIEVKTTNVTNGQEQSEVKFLGINSGGQRTGMAIITGEGSLWSGDTKKITATGTGAEVFGNLTISGTVDGIDIATRDAILTSTTTTASEALPLDGGTMTGIITFDASQSFPGTASGSFLGTSGGAMTGPITTNSTFDGVDVGARDGVLTTTTATANAALPATDGVAKDSVTGAASMPTGTTAQRPTGALGMFRHNTTLNQFEGYNNGAWGALAGAAGLAADAVPLLSEVSSTLNGATGTVVHNTGTSGVFYHTAPAANFTANFTNVPTTGDRITTVALIIAQGVTQYMPTAVQIGGAAQTIEWFGGGVAGGTANGFDIVSFTLIRQSSTWTVLGASSTYG